MTQPDMFSNQAVPIQAPVQHRSKIALAWMACVFGLFGAHWWYLGRPKAWTITAFSVLMLAVAHMYPIWWDNPFFLLLIIPATAGFIEAVVFALTPDERFDVKYNPLSGRKTHTGWSAVIVAIVGTLVGSGVLIYGIAMTVIYVSKATGWLDGYVF